MTANFGVNRASDESFGRGNGLNQRIDIAGHPLLFRTTACNKVIDLESLSVMPAIHRRRARNSVLGRARDDAK